MDLVETNPPLTVAASGSSLLDDIPGCLHQLASEDERLAHTVIRNRVLRSLPLMKRSAAYDLLIGAIGILRPRYDEATTRFIAYHEAGHAVLCRHAGVQISRITFPHRGFFISAQVSKGKRRRPYSAEANILMSLGGAAAADLVAAQCKLHPLWGACADFSNARANEIFGAADRTHVDQMLLRHFMPIARSVIAAEGQALTALADELCDRRWMPGHEVESLLDRHWAGTAPDLRLNDPGGFQAELTAAWKASHDHRMTNLMMIVFDFERAADERAS